MIEKDIAGDPSGRISIAAPKVAIDLSSNRGLQRGRIAFDVDSDAVEIATDWRLEEKPIVCSPRECVIGVIYHVVATTTGYGMPSWDKPQGREIHPLDKSAERLVKYRFTRVGGEWKIIKFPVPYVHPNVLKEFFKKEYKEAESAALPANQDERAARNRDIVRAWRLRQIDLLDKLPL